MSQSLLLRRLELYARIQLAKRPDITSLSIKEREAELKIREDLHTLAKSYQTGHCFGLSVIYSSMGAAGKLEWWENTVNMIMDNKNWSVPENFDWQKLNDPREDINLSDDVLQQISFEVKNADGKPLQVNPIEFAMSVMSFYQGEYFSSMAKYAPNLQNKELYWYLADVFNRIAIFFKDLLAPFFDTEQIWNSEFNVFSSWFKKPSDLYIKNMETDNKKRFKATYLK